MRLVIEVPEDFHTELKLTALKQKKTFTQLILPWVEKGYNQLQQIKNTAKKNKPNKTSKTIKSSKPSKKERQKVNQ